MDMRFNHGTVSATDPAVGASFSGTIGAHLSTNEPFALFRMGTVYLTINLSISSSSSLFLNLAVL